MSLFEQKTGASAREVEKRYREFSARLLECFQQVTILEELPRSIGQLQDRTAIAQVALTTAIHATRALRGGAYVLSGNRWERLAVQGKLSDSLPLEWVPFFQSRSAPLIQNRPGGGKLPDVVTVAPGFHSFLVSPLMNQETLLGILALFDTRKDEFCSTDAKMVGAITSQAAASLANEEDRRRLIAGQEEARLTAMAGTAGKIAQESRNRLTQICEELQSIRTSIGQETAEGLDGRLDSVVHSAGEMGALLQDLLRCARPEIHPTDCRLQEIVNGTLDMVRAQDRSHPAEFSVSIPEDLPPGYWDPGQIQQILLGLVSNAADAMGEKGGTVSIVASTHPATGHVQIVVSDQGPGIPSELRWRVFEPLFTTKDFRNGVGLAACSQIAKAHGGTLRVDAGAKQGARLILSLPPRSDPPNIGQASSPRTVDAAASSPAT